MQVRLVALAALGVAACSGSESPTEDTGGGGSSSGGFGGAPDFGPGLMVGIESDVDVAERVSWLRVTVSRDGDDEALEYGRNGGPELRFPLEIPVASQRNGAPIDVELEAFDSEGDVVVERRASTVARVERMLLLRLRLEDECREGQPKTPSCDAEQTCVARHCADPFIKPEALPDYDESWAEPYADACCDIDAGPATALLGSGEDGFSPLAPDEELYLEAGPQGGYHVWLGVHIENLHEGAKTMLRAYAPTQPYEILAMPSLEPYQPAGDGCEISGLRYELHLDSGTSASVLIGEPLHLEVTVIDPTGKAAIAELDAILTDVPPPK